ncbi:hypothetical protein RVY68_23170 [Phocaeicola vulgatus]|uniref:Uncharacterized protein n=1 Tax=Phocaeicola vulgatus TaxID=821 RepID=A0AAE4RVG5_PHOVU|nr:hypothetical protein [Phocaeicola vulgatus]MDU0251473.1 hypothetical protein [Phocaeicola vulgatus]
MTNNKKREGGEERKKGREGTVVKERIKKECGNRIERIRGKE